MPEQGDNFSREPLEHRDKVMLGVIGGVGALVLLLGYLQLAVHIRSSFNPARVNAPSDLSKQYQQQQDILNSLGQSGITVSDEMRTKDTDKDGLSDYDEFQVYKTSAYLDDTDSDGIKDAEEVRTGSDPNCPRGRTCRQESSAASIEEVPSSQTVPPASAAQIDIEAELRNAVPLEKLRELLLEQGLTQTQVDQIDDETLRQLYEETLKEISKQANQN